MLLKDLGMVSNKWKQYSVLVHGKIRENNLLQIRSDMFCLKQTIVI